MTCDYVYKWATVCRHVLVYYYYHNDSIWLNDNKILDIYYGFVVGKGGWGIGSTRWRRRQRHPFLVKVKSTICVSFNFFHNEVRHTKNLHMLINFIEMLSGVRTVLLKSWPVHKFRFDFAAINWLLVPTSAYRIVCKRISYENCSFNAFRYAFRNKRFNFTVCAKNKRSLVFSSSIVYWTFAICECITFGTLDALSLPVHSILINRNTIL